MRMSNLLGEGAQDGDVMAAKEPTPRLGIDHVTVVPTNFVPPVDRPEPRDRADDDE